jgi:hypothetical protein
MSVETLTRLQIATGLGAGRAPEGGRAASGVAVAAVVAGPSAQGIVNLALLYGGRLVAAAAGQPILPAVAPFGPARRS